MLLIFAYLTRSSVILSKHRTSPLMYEIDMDLDIANIREDFCLPPEQISRVRLSRVVILDGIHQLLINESMRHRLNLQIDYRVSTGPGIGPGKLRWLPENVDSYEPIQEVIMRTYQEDHLTGRCFAAPILIPNLPWDLVLGSSHFFGLGFKWDDERKCLVPLLSSERTLHYHTATISASDESGARDPLRRLL